MSQSDIFPLPVPPDVSSIILELVPASDETNPALVNALGRAVVESLERDGYDLHPVYTGMRGGPFLVEVMHTITQTATFVWANHATIEEAINDTSAVVTIMGVVIPLIKRVFHTYETQVGTNEAREHPIKVTVTIEGASIEIEAQDMAQVDAALTAAQKYAAAYPLVARQVSAKSKPTVQGRIQSKPRRRRK
jgi:polyisoprenoid-binding protein YceI